MSNVYKAITTINLSEFNIIYRVSHIKRFINMLNSLMREMVTTVVGLGLTLITYNIIFIVWHSISYLQYVIDEFGSTKI